MIEKDFKLPPVGKELSKDIPADFFERLPEQTLLLAKQRMERNRRTKRRYRSIVLLSSAAAVFLLLIVVPPMKQKSALKAEKVEDVLRDLSVDDLSKMTVVYSSDMMEEEMTTENTY